MMRMNNPPTYIRRRFRILEKIIRDTYRRINPDRYNSFEQYIDIVNYYTTLEFRLIEFDNIRTDRIQLRDDVMDVLYGLFKNEIQTYYNSNKTIREEVEETSKEIKEKKLAGLIKGVIPQMLSHKGLVSVDVYTPSEIHRKHPNFYDESHPASFITVIDINLPDGMDVLDADNRNSDDIRREVVHITRSLFNILPVVLVRWQTPKKTISENTNPIIGFLKQHLPKPETINDIVIDGNYITVYLDEEKTTKREVELYKFNEKTFKKFFNDDIKVEFIFMYPFDGDVEYTKDGKEYEVIFQKQINDYEIFELTGILKPHWIGGMYEFVPDDMSDEEYYGNHWEDIEEFIINNLED